MIVATLYCRHVVSGKLTLGRSKRVAIERGPQFASGAPLIIDEM